MNQIINVQKAIEYIEENLTNKIEYEMLAKKAYCSTYHFQRIFGLTCGITIGEYIRKRRLTLAGEELLKNQTKIIELALKYGYETPESFTRAFNKFHGINPSKVKDESQLNSFSRITLSATIKDTNLKYTVKELPEKILVGYKKRFTGAPYGEERAKQEQDFLTTTRAKQWLLLGASHDYSTDYMIIDNVNDEGYDFYVAYDLDEWTRDALFNPTITGVDFIDKLGFEIIKIPKQTYVAFETEKKKRPILDYVELRHKISSKCLSNENLKFINAPEIVAMHWRPNGVWEKERYIEILLPIEIN